MGTIIRHPVPSAPSGDDGSDRAAELRKYLAMVRRRWYVIVIGIALGYGAVALWLANTLPIYTANSQILIDPRKERVLKTEAVVSDLSLDVSSVSTEVALIQSYAVAERVVSDLNLNNRQLFSWPDTSFDPIGWLQGLYTSLLRHLPSPGAPSSNGPAPAQPDANTLRTYYNIAHVRANVAARRVGTTFLIDIYFSHPDPAVAAELANAVANAYLAEQIDARLGATKRAAAWLKEQVATVRVQLAASERAVAEHRAKHNLTSSKVGSLSATVAAQQAAEINAQLVAARAQTIEKKAKYEEAQRIIDKDIGGQAAGWLLESPIISLLRQQEAELARVEAELVTRLGPVHPSIIKTRAERDDIRKQMSRELVRLAVTLKTDYEFALKREETLVASLQELTTAENRNDRAVIELRELERETQSNSYLHDSLLTRLKDIEQQSSLQTTESRIIAPAARPGVPAYPNKGRALLLGVVGGLAFGFLGAFLLHLTERGFATAEEVEDALNVPVLALVPHLSRAERRVKGRAVPLHEYLKEKPFSHYGESIRRVRVGARMSKPSKNAGLILVTSALPREGKTTVSLALACSAAAYGQRTLVVDADLRHSTLSTMLKLGKAEGLTAVLQGRADLDEVIVDADVPGLKVLPAGSSMHNAADLFGTERLPQLLQTLSKSYDFVYIDSTPLSPVVDSALLSKYVDAVVMVVHWRMTPRQVVKRALQTIDRYEEKVPGIVLNNVRFDQISDFGSNYGYVYQRSKEYFS